MWQLSCLKNDEMPLKNIEPLKKKHGEYPYPVHRKVNSSDSIYAEDSTFRSSKVEQYINNGLEWGYIQSRYETQALSHRRSSNNRGKDYIIQTAIEEAIRTWDQERENIMKEVFWSNLGFFDRFTPDKWKSIDVKESHVDFGELHKILILLSYNGILHSHGFRWM
ncbi:MAG: hypothetical protein GY714_24745 [Desulfobacterales bacterium]|nr:hypothetical protein [Desulfobacterales bacterium]